MEQATFDQRALLETTTTALQQQSVANQQTMLLAQQAATTNAQLASVLDRALEANVGKATDRWRAWQQIPAWVVGASGLVMAFLLAFDVKGVDADNDRAWAFVFVTLVVGMLLSYRSAFVIKWGGKNEDDGGSTGESSGGGNVDGGGAGGGAAPPAGSGGG